MRLFACPSASEGDRPPQLHELNVTLCFGTLPQKQFETFGILPQKQFEIFGILPQKQFEIFGI